MNATQTTKINLIKYTVVIFLASSGFISSRRNFLITAQEMGGKFQSGPGLTRLKAFLRNIKKAKEHQHLRVTRNKSKMVFDQRLIHFHRTSLELFHL